MTNRENLAKLDVWELATWIWEHGCRENCENCPCLHAPLNAGGCNLTDDLKFDKPCKAFISIWLDTER